MEFSIPAHCNSRLQHLLQSSIHHQGGDAVRLLALFSCCTIKHDNKTMVIKVAGLLVTVSALLVIEENMQWLIAGSSERPAIRIEEAMSNLIEVVSAILHNIGHFMNCFSNIFRFLGTQR